MIYITSDYHFNHNQEFIIKPRGFKDIEEMNESLIFNTNKIVTDDDDLYILGDLMLGDNTKGIECLSRLKGKKHIVPGNHCTDNRIKLYKNLPNLVEISDALKIKQGKWLFYCTHWPSRVGNFEEKRKFFNLHGHTHSSDKFQFISDNAYNVSLEAHNNFPVSLLKIIEDIKNYKINTCE